MIRLYHAPLSRSCRVRWMLEELGLACELVPMQVSAASLRTPEYLAVNPNRRVPAIAADEFSAADVMPGYTLQLSRLMRQLEGHSHAAAYLEGLSKRPAFEKAFAR